MTECISVVVRYKIGLSTISTKDWYGIRRDVVRRLYDNEDISVIKMSTSDRNSILKQSS